MAEKEVKSDDQISTTAAPTEAEGGSAQIDPKKAKKVDPNADTVKVEEVEVEAEEVVEEVIEIDASVSSLFEGEEFSDEFKNKVTVVFEAAVNEQVESKVASLAEETTERLETEMQEKLEESVQGIVENLDKYLDYVVEQWMEENELAIESGIKVEMAESLMSGLKTLFEDHNVDVSEETLDVVADLEKEVADLKESSNDLVNANIELQTKIDEYHAEKVFEEIVEGLTDIEVERFKVLAGNLNKKDLEEYTENLKVIKESFFADAPAETDVHGDEEEPVITEEEAPKTAPASEYGSVNALVEALNARKNKQ
jgi:hypothetical protein